MLELRRELRRGGQLRAGGDLNDRYVLLDDVGRGGFGNVWRAKDRTNNQTVAVKVLHPDQARDASKRERFFRGARLMDEVRAQGIVRVLERYAEDDGYYYFVMEYIDGPNLAQAISSQAVSKEEAVKAILLVGDAVAAAHARGIVHRDIKPANIIMASPIEPKLTDFDLVMGPDTTGGTRTGGLGSYLFAAPEQHSSARDADRRSDIYSLGMTAIFCIHGALPETVLWDREGVIWDLACSSEMKSVLERAIAIRPEHRYPDVSSFCSALSAARLFDADSSRVNAARRPTPFTLTTRRGREAEKPTAKPKVIAIGVGAAFAVAGLAAATYRPIANFLSTLQSAAPTAASAPLLSLSLPPKPVGSVTADADDGAPERDVALVLFPLDARVMLGDQDLGQMPVSVRVREGRPLKVRIVRDGYWSRKLTLDGSKKRVVIGLVKRDASKSDPNADDDDPPGAYPRSVPAK